MLFLLWISIFHNFSLTFIIFLKTYILCFSHMFYKIKYPQVMLIHFSNLEIHNLIFNSFQVSLTNNPFNIFYHSYIFFEVY